MIAALTIGLGLHLGVAGVGLPAPSITLDAPVSNAILLVGKAYTVTGTCTSGVTVKVYWNAVELGDAIVVGTDWTYAWTPTSGQEGVFNLTAIATNPVGGLFTESSAQTPLVLADCYFRVRANTAATYTETAGALTSLVNEKTGAAMSTIVGTPGFTADDAGSGKAAFTFNGSSAVRGTEAAVLAALGTAPKAHAAFIVHRLNATDADGALFGAGNSATDAHAIGWWQLSTGAGLWGFYRQGATSRIWDQTATASGRRILETRTTDGLTVLSRQNGGSEGTETLTSLTITAPTRFALGEWPDNTPSNYFTGSIHEIILIDAHKSSTIMDAVRERLTTDWI